MTIKAKPSPGVAKAPGVNPHVLAKKPVHQSRVRECPFCAGPASVSDGVYKSVRCDAVLCRAEGPRSGSITDAIRRWNLAERN